VSNVLAQELPWAVHAVMRGELWVKPSVIDQYVAHTNLYLNRLAPYSGWLTPREYQVIGCIVNGFSNKQISNALHISERTVKFHVANVFQKMNVTSRSTLLAGLQCTH
jgi:DNA-binding NarL/FixJ family response regulator